MKNGSDTPHFSSCLEVLRCCKLKGKMVNTTGYCVGFLRHIKLRYQTTAVAGCIFVYSGPWLISFDDTSVFIVIKWNFLHWLYWSIFRVICALHFAPVSFRTHLLRSNAILSCLASNILIVLFLKVTGFSFSNISEEQSNGKMQNLQAS